MKPVVRLAIVVLTCGILGWGVGWVVTSLLGTSLLSLSIVVVASSILGPALAKIQDGMSLLGAGVVGLAAISILGLTLAMPGPDRSPASAPPTPSEDLLVTEWIGIAASPNGKVFGIANQSDETVARSSAKYGCEQETGRTCTAIAIPMAWDFTVLTCSRPGQTPLPIVAGSDQNAATDEAFKQAVAVGVDPKRCTQVYSS